MSSCQDSDSRLGTQNPKDHVILLVLIKSYTDRSDPQTSLNVCVRIRFLLTKLLTNLCPKSKCKS